MRQNEKLGFCDSAGFAFLTGDSDEQPHLSAGVATQDFPSIKPISVFPRPAFSFTSLSVYSVPLQCFCAVNRATHLALVPLCHLAKDFKVLIC